MSVFVIGEAGSNHCGDLALAVDLVDAAQRAGCDAVKFQAIKRDRVWDDPESRPKWTEQGEWFFGRIADYCKTVRIEFMCTPFSKESVEWLAPMVHRWKVASAHIEDGLLWSAIKKTDMPVLVSTGFTTPDRVRVWLDRPDIPNEIIPLVCVSEYPANPERYALQTWAGALWPHEWGVSDHTVGYGTACAAVGLGARWVEKHIKLVNQPESPDQGPHALEPEPLADFVAMVREAERARTGAWLPALRPKGRKLYVR